MYLPTWSCSLDCGDCSRRGPHHLLSETCLDQRLDLSLHQGPSGPPLQDSMGTSGVVANLCRVLFPPYQANLREFARICANVRESARVCANLRESARVCANLRESARVCANLREFVRICASVREFTQVWFGLVWFGLASL